MWIVTQSDIDDWIEKNKKEPTDQDIEYLNRSLVYKIFFPGRGQSSAPGFEICKTCPVNMHCLEYGLFNREIYGTWGGSSQRMRRRAASQRAFYSKNSDVDG